MTVRRGIGYNMSLNAALEPISAVLRPAPDGSTRPLA